MNKNKNQTPAVKSPAIRRYFFAVAFLLLLCFSAVDCAAQKRPENRIRINAIQAKLFFNNTGTFSENVLTEKGADLWNSPFDATYSTLVMVELDGLPEYLAPVLQIELTARYIPFDRVKRGVVVRQVETIRNGTEDGKSYAGFWLTRTGCNPVYLTARIVGRKQRFRRTINFGCGE